jgi:hypothetical protein
MKKSELPPGTRVIASAQDAEEYDYYGKQEVVKYHPEDYDEQTLTGVVIDKPANRGKVWVRWDEDSCRDIDGDEEELDPKVLSLEANRSELDKEFKVAAAAIKKKIEEAAKIVREANKMAQDAGVRNLEEMMYDAASPLVSAMDDSGWRSSSWGC